LGLVPPWLGILVVEHIQGVLADFGDGPIRIFRALFEHFQGGLCHASAHFSQAIRRSILGFSGRLL